MSLMYPDKLASNNPKAFGLVDASQVSGHRSVKTINDLYSIPDVILSQSGNNTNGDAIGQLIWVTDIQSFFQLSNWAERLNDKGWKSYSMAATVYQGETAPADTTFLWYTEDTPTTPIPVNDALLKQIQERMDKLELKSNFFEYAFTRKMDSGGLDFFAGNEFKITDGIKPGTEGDINFTEAEDQEPQEPGSLGVVEIEPKDWAEALQPNVAHFCVKRGKANEMGNYTIQDGEFVYIKDKNFLYIGNDGKWKLINSSSGGGGTDPEEPEDPDNPDMKTPIEYIDLIAEDMPTRNFRVRVTSTGKLKIYDASIETAEDQKILQNNAECLKGLVISNVYAGPDGAKPTDFNVCSHSYIELYNSTTLDINLKGCSVQHSSIKQSWGVIPLKGIIPANSCFTIRCNQISDITANTTRTVIDDYDMDCPDVVLSNLGFKLYIGIGIIDINQNNPWSSTGFLNGYIDCVGIKNKDNSIANDVNGFETSVPNLLNDVRGAVRMHLADYNTAQDSNNNSKDFLPFDLSTDIDIENANEVYKPWSSKRGPKTLFYNRTKFSDKEPNMPTMSIGFEPTTRTFNWISVGYYDEFLWYKKTADTTWTKVESFKTGDYKRNRVKGFDGIHFTVHKQIIKNFSNMGSYVWKCGREGCMSEEFYFNVFGSDANQQFKFVHVSDQQDFTFGGYEPWGIALKKIIETENDNNYGQFPHGDGTNGGIHFFLNTGDMSQNGNRPAEWMDYYNACNRGEKIGKKVFPHVPQMNVVGNNDLCPLIGELSGKVNPDSFEYFYCYEYDKTPATFEKQKYQNVPMKSVYAFDYCCAHFVCVNSNNYIEEQKAWFIAHMEEVKKRTFKPKWLIFVTHDAMFNITIDTTETAKVGSGKRDTKLNQPTDPDVQKRFSWSRLAEQYGFRVCLSGHKHTYSRSYPLKETIQTPSDANQNLPVNYLRPTFSTNVETGDGITYIMTQATGYKLQSNKDVPAQGIEWLAKYFPGSNNASAAGQKAPTFCVYTISPTQFIMRAYQVLNVTNGSTWNCFNGGQAGVTDYNNITVSKIDEVVITYK